MQIVVGLVIVSLAIVYLGIGWWLTSGGRDTGRARLKESAILPGLIAVFMIVVIWDAYRHPAESGGWD